MGVVVGVLVGYALGSKAGSDAWPELEDAWRTIVASEEVRDLLSGGVSVARDLLGRRGELIAGVLGFTTIAGASIALAKILFMIFLVLFVVSLVMHLIRGRTVV